MVFVVVAKGYHYQGGLAPEEVSPACSASTVAGSLESDREGGSGLHYGADGYGDLYDDGGGSQSYGRTTRGASWDEGSKLVPGGGAGGRAARMSDSATFGQI